MTQITKSSGDVFKDLGVERPTAQTALESEVEFLEWAYETLGEINPSNYGHDDVCELNDKSVEVILAIKARLKAFGFSPEVHADA